MTLKKKSKLALLVLAIVTTITITSRAQETPPASSAFVVDEVISKVDNYIVLKSDLERAYQDYVTNGGSPNQRVKCQYLAMLVRSKLMLAKAEIDSVVVLDAEVDANTKQRMDMILSNGRRVGDVVR
jgi:peptidyl-prolyl cis-trans isomerase SurA